MPYSFVFLLSTWRCVRTSVASPPLVLSLRRSSIIVYPASSIFMAFSAIHVSCKHSISHGYYSKRSKIFVTLNPCMFRLPICIPLDYHCFICCLEVCLVLLEPFDLSFLYYIYLLLRCRYVRYF